MACSQAKKEPVILMKSDFCDLYQNFDKFIDSNDQNVENYLKDFIKKWENGDGKKIAKDKKLDLTKPEIRLLKVFFEYSRTNEIAFYQEKKCLEIGGEH
jgi:hypothetical protein